MTKMKITVKEINEISRAMMAIEKENIAFSDFDFNLSMATLKNATNNISEAYDKTMNELLKVAKKENIPMVQDAIDKILDKKHEIEIPEITVELLKKTGVPLPLSALSALSRYIEKKK